MGHPAVEPSRAPSIGDGLRHFAATWASFGAHTQFDEGPVTVTATVTPLTVTPTVSTFDSDGVNHLYSRSSELSMSVTTSDTVETVNPP
jgi:hypothetical protein